MDHGGTDTILVGSYDYLLVALSVVIAILAAYAALDLARRVTSAHGTARVLWLISGATAMGLGIWSMHYIGMLAFRLPIPVQYDWPTVLLSLLAAILASATALLVVSRRNMDLRDALLGSVLMGSGIATMHYVGMAAMRMEAMCLYSSWLVVLSIVLAIVISLVALWLTFHFRSAAQTWSWAKSLSAVVMGLAIPVMHYTGMAAVTVVPAESGHGDLTHAVSVSALSVAGIAIVTFVVLGTILLTSLRFDTLPTPRQLTARYFVSLGAIGALAALGTLVVQYQGRQEQADAGDLEMQIRTILRHDTFALETVNTIVDHYESEANAQAARKDQLHLMVLLSIFGVLLVQALVVLRPALVRIQRAIRQLERAKGALHRKATFVELLQVVAAAANEATSVDGVLQFTVEQICKRTGWPVGYVYFRAPVGGGVLVPSSLRYLRSPEQFKALCEVTTTSLLAVGVGLPGRVAASGKPAWIPDIHHDDNFPRSRVALDLGVRGAFAFPVLVQGEVVSVLEFFSTRVEEPDEELLGVMANIGAQLSQVVERTRAQEKVAHKAEELARSNAELEHFAYVASHDLQEPLRMVASYTQLLARRYQGKLGADADEFIGFAVDGATRMQTLIRDLLSYSRVTRKAQSLQPVDARAACDDACRNLQKSIEDSGASVSVGSLPKVVADATQLTQLFQNLIGNAIKYRNERRPEIRVAARAERNDWVFSVQDNGIGIDAQYSERIFQMFQRLHTRAEYPGTGIGLAICRKIVERHGGRIWVESLPGQGSTFHFTIPQTQGLAA